MRGTLAHLWIGIYAAISIVFYFFPSTIVAADQNSIIAKTTYQSELNINDTDISITVYPVTNSISNSQNNDLILWLPSDHGLPDSITTIAKSLSQKKIPQHSQIEVWVADVLSSLFLASQASSIDKVPVTILYELIKKVHNKTQKRIFLVASGKGALLAMRASHYWLQDSLTNKQFGGLVLLYPNLFTRTPEPGSSADYYPVTHAVSAPIYILQPENSPWRWQLATLQQHLVNAQARPYISILPGIRDRFFFRPDATKAEQVATKKLASTIQSSLQYLRSENISKHAIPNKLQATFTSNTKKKTVKQHAKLRVYQKNPTPPALSLNLLSGKASSLAQYKGKVVVVNFWASWCPPCVQEMPSMEKIYQHYSLSDFTILAVNMAEDTDTIHEFLKNRVNVSFPILLDFDGKALKDWQVFAFPSSYVIDKKGKIRYALFGSILWDTPQVTVIIEKLLAE